jgi:multidrug efflux pump subunit AcrA (membrane-fusion protein)
MKRPPIIPIIAVAMFVFACAYVISVHKTVHATTPPIAPTEQWSAGSVAAVGLVEPESEDIALSCAVSGMVTHLYVKAGDHVHSGDPLFSVDDRDVRSQLETREATLDSAKASLSRLEKVPRPEEVPPAEALVEASKADVADAEVQFRLIQSVTDRRAVSLEDVERRRLALEGAKARLAVQERNLALLKAGTWAPDLAIARASVRQDDAAVNETRVALERLTTRAPMDGLVLQNHVRLGQYAQCGNISDPLMLFGGGKDLHIRVDVSEADAWRVRPGVHGIASVRGNSAMRFPISFVRFEPYVIPKMSLTGDSTERVDTRVLEVIFRFDQSTDAVYVGQQMDVYIEGRTPPGPVSRQEGSPQ